MPEKCEADRMRPTRTDAKEPFVANAILNLLRVWKRRNDTPHPRPWIVTDADLSLLEEWAAELAERHDKTVAWYKKHGFPLTERSVSVGRFPAR